VQAPEATGRSNEVRGREVAEGLEEKGRRRKKNLSKSTSKISDSAGCRRAEKLVLTCRRMEQAG
jgi:hypothetical protein